MGTLVHVGVISTVPRSQTVDAFKCSFTVPITPFTYGDPSNFPVPAWGLRVLMLFCFMFHYGCPKSAKDFGEILWVKN